MRSWKKCVTTLMVGVLVGLMATAGQAASSPEVQKLIVAHRQAAVEAQKKVAFHEEMEKSFREGRGGSKIDMVGHCKFWADYYQKLAAQEEQAAKDLEK